VRHSSNAVVQRLHLPPSALSAVASASDDRELTDELLRSLFEGRRVFPNYAYPHLSCPPALPFLKPFSSMQRFEMRTFEESSCVLIEPLLSIHGLLVPSFPSHPNAIHVYVNSNATDTGIPLSEQTQSTP
jgi:hypothetical protein